MLRFEGEDALLGAITSGLVPADLAARPARAFRDADGAVVVVPEKPLGKSASQALAKAGVRTDPEAEKRATTWVEGRSWAELIAPRRRKVIASDQADEAEGTVLFVPPD